MKPTIIVKYSLLLSLLLSGYLTQAQDYFVIKNDTTFCTSITNYRLTAQHYVKRLEFIGTDGQKQEINGTKNLKELTTMYINGSYIDRVPLKAHKPKSYVRYDKREVNGTLKVYIDEAAKITTVYTNFVGDLKTKTNQYGAYRFYIKMPDGTYYRVNKKKNMKKYIKPFLLQCPEFKNAYNGTFNDNVEEFITMIELYNSLCK